MESALKIGYLTPIALNPAFFSSVNTNNLLTNCPNFFIPMLGIQNININQANIHNDELNKTREEINENKDNHDQKAPRIKFTPEEDEQLKRLVEKIGCRQWNKIAEFMPGRNGRQCRDRYQNYLSPGFRNGHWTKEEDETILNKFQEMGPQWSKMTEFFKKRNANAIKNRWYYFVSKHINDINEYVSKKKAKNTNKKKIDEIFDYDFYVSFTEMNQINGLKAINQL